MRTDLTKEACLKIWNKHKADIEETIDKAKTKELDGNTHICQCKFKFENTGNTTWTDKSKLEYINKIILTIENSTDYD
jgi:hypothetical protein